MALHIFICSAELKNKKTKFCSSGIMVLPIMCWLLHSHDSGHHMIPHIQIKYYWKFGVGAFWYPTKIMHKHEYDWILPSPFLTSICIMMQYIPYWKLESQTLHLNAFCDWRFKTNNKNLLDWQWTICVLKWKKKKKIRITVWRLKASTLFKLFVIHLIKE